MTSPSLPPELLSLCGKVRDESISPTEFAELEQILLADPEAMSFYLQFMTICSGLEQLAVVEADRFNVQLNEDANSSQSEFHWVTKRSESKTPNSPDSASRPSNVILTPAKTPHPTPRLAVGVVAAFASVAALIAVLILRPEAGVGPISSPPSSLNLASVVEAYQAVWLGNQPGEVGSELREGEFSLASGAARIRYRNGAELLVQAPSVFSIDTPTHSTLRAGSLTLYVPPTATGFQVETPWGTVVDHGTRIGVSADDEEGMQIHVFEGKAEAIGKDSLQRQMLSAGEAVAVSDAAGTEELTRMDVRPIYFQQSLDHLGYLPTAVGDVELLVAPPRSTRRVRSELVDLGRASIFAEQRGVTIPKELSVSLSEPGEVTLFNRQPARVPGGVVVDSFLIQLTIPHKLRSSTEILTVEGTIEFQRPVTGVIAYNPARFTELLGNPETDYPRDRDTGLEGPTESTPGDALRLSEDRRTLHFSLHVHGREAAANLDYVDQFRVLIESTP